MKLLSYLQKRNEQLGLLYNGNVYDMQSLHPQLLSKMSLFLGDWDMQYKFASEALEQLQKGKLAVNSIPLEQLQLLSPIPKPSSMRDGYAFRQHVAAARRNRKVPMIPEFDEYPVFYFTNHQAVQGPGNIYCMPDHFNKLDFELECAIIICKEGKNIKAKDADGYIGGLMVMNDLSARTLQMEEMLLNLGPAKGKDFSTTLGPYLVTTDELQKYEVPCKPNHEGKSWNLAMKCFVNGKQVSSGNLADMDWTFAELIERASYGVTLYPGDVIGSGTVGTGCFLELNGTGKLQSADYKEQWLQHGDEIEMEIEALGKLSNTIVKESTDYSILQLKKKYAHQS